MARTVFTNSFLLFKFLLITVDVCKIGELRTERKNDCEKSTSALTSAYNPALISTFHAGDDSHRQKLVAERHVLLVMLTNVLYPQKSVPVAVSDARDEKDKGKINEFPKLVKFCIYESHELL